MGDQFEMLEHAKQTMMDLAIRFGPKVLVAIALLVVGTIVARWSGRLITRGLRKFPIEPPARQLLVRIVHIFIVGLFLIMAMQNLGIELLPLIAGLGVAGAGIALAMQGMLGNLVAGLTVIFTKPFSVGEYISIVGEEGRVENISLFTTVLSHTDMSQVVIPNRKIVGEILHNYGKIRQINVTMSVALHADVDGALSAVNGILQNNSRILKEPAPIVGVVARAPSSIDLIVKPWVAVTDYELAASEITRTIIEAFRTLHVPLPIPQRQVQLLSPPEHIPRSGNLSILQPTT